jgi:D-3-phosphoglycerate dehydrogenase
MRILLADKLDDLAIRRLGEAGWEVISEPGLAGPTLEEGLRRHDPDALVVRSTKVTAAHVAAGRSLGLVIRAGAGVNTIDLDACSARGVFVSNCPGKNAVAVAELAFGLMLALDRRLPGATAEVAAGRWRKSAWAKGAGGLKGRVLGVYGCGRIGTEVIRRAHAFGMRVVAWSRELDDDLAAALGVARRDDPVAVAREADVLTIHLPSTPETRGLVGDEILGALREGAILINTARAELVDEAALLRAVREKGLRAGLDVLSIEPAGEAEVSHPLLAEPGVLVTPHLGASTAEASEAVAAEVVRIAREWAESGRVPNVVNLESQHGGEEVLVVRHLDRVGVLATVLDQLRTAGLNVEDMENVVLAGGRAAVARIHVRGRVPAELVASLEAAEHVLRVTRTEVDA